MQNNEGLLYDYSATLNADIFYHFDFYSDVSGIVTGLGYQIKRYVFDYSTDYQNYKLSDIYTVNEITLPIIFKYRPNIWDTQRYVYVGARLNYRLCVKDKNNYQEQLSFKLDKKEFKPFSLSLILGFNYCILDFEIEYQLNSIFKTSYTNSLGNKIYSNQKGGFIFLKTSIHLCPQYISDIGLPYRIPRTKLGHFYIKHVAVLENFKKLFKMSRNIKTYLFFILLTLTLGLVSRKFPQLFHPFLAEYLGDTMWALLVFWLFRIIIFQKSTVSIALLALSFSFVIETSQLYHAPWIDSIRSTTVGALVLGHGFLWSDLVCYTVGVTIGVLVEVLLVKKKQN